MDEFPPQTYPQTPQPPLPKPSSKKKIIIAVLIIVAVAVVLTLFLFSSLIFGKPTKPVINKSVLDHLNVSYNGTMKNESALKFLTGDINYLANELGAYALHDNPISKEKPEIEIYISDSSQYFTVTVKKNIPLATETKSKNPDIKIITDSETLRNALTSSNLNKEVLAYYQSGKIVVVVMKSFDILFLKGYKEIYSSLNVGTVKGGVDMWTSILGNFPFSQKTEGFFL
jgi:hypothetical protein